MCYDIITVFNPQLRYERIDAIRKEVIKMKLLYVTIVFLVVAAMLFAVGAAFRAMSVVLLNAI